jgi:hypothetical protein
VPTDPFSILLVVGVVVLAITTSVMARGLGPIGLSRGRKDRGDRANRRRQTAPNPSTELALRGARERAARHHADSIAAAPALAPTGQIIDLPDGRSRHDRDMTPQDAREFAVHMAETDPERVAEVISQWIRADSTRRYGPLR